ncbi:hypothetical protein JGH11_19175 [Dysgonomonas sp. Marseille-P4677]|uniref:hypothetical protein n=1 Tax=Dysgonomonas sp. Marseille-P4677 TaxID=2364790 RepID=UPI00191228E6|nr:hypothetical protein [Dysgonomonas sp. Marseille-P4677]MBK5722995.1 hypothetical protein [Dysgonomonas sp. Marseille-P4677]
MLSDLSINRITILTILLLLTIVGKAQQAATNEEKYKVTPVSPNTASLGLYGHTPIGHYTGTPNINIPLYEIDLDGKKIPINISYHASGIKVSQEASSIGLGWTLNIGGCITKTVLGGDDFKPNNTAYKGFYEDNISLTKLDSTIAASNKLTGNVFGKYYSYLDGLGDSEPDMYYYNFAGYSGEMFFDRINTVYKGYKNTTTAAKAILQSPKEYISFIYNPSTEVWSVKDINGYIYGFKEVETSATYSFTSGIRLNYDEEYLKSLQTYQLVSNITTAWYLEYIESPQKNRVTFEYEAEYLYTPVTLTENVYIYDGASLLEYTKYDIDPQGQKVTLKRNYEKYTYSYNKIKQLRPTKVSFNGGTVLINADNRIDLRSVPNTTTPKKISSIQVKNNLDQQIKSYSFSYSYRGGDNYISTRLFLDRLSEIYEGKEVVYSFQYNQGSLPAKNSLETDFWGYYNMGQIEGSPISFYTIPSISSIGKLYYGRNKRPSLALLQNGTLIQIQYPTGGITEFYYEPHDISFMRTYLTSRLVSNSTISKAYIPTSADDRCKSPTNAAAQKLYGDEFIIEKYTETAGLNFRITDLCQSCLCSQPPSGMNNEIYVWLEVFDGTNFVKYKDIYQKDVTFYLKFSYSDMKSSNGTIDKSNQSAFKGIPPGRYRLCADIRPLYFIDFQIYAAVNYLKDEEVKDGINLGAGLRIKKIIDKGNGGEKAEVRTFSYSKANLMYQPTFNEYQIIAADYFIISSIGGGSAGVITPYIKNVDYREYLLANTSSIVPFSNAAQGNVVGYDSVTEFLGENGEYGSIEYNFINNANTTIGMAAENYIPFFPTRKNYLNGYTLDITKYSKCKELIRREIFNYITNNIKDITVFKTHVPAPLASTDGAFFGFYDIKVGETTLKDKTIISYVNGKNAQTSKTNYSYNADYLLITTEKTEDSEGKEVSKIIKYPFDYIDNISKGMVDRSLIGIPIEEITSVNSKVVSANKTIYKDTLGLYLPSQIYSFNSTIPQSLPTYSNYFKNDYTFIKYNNKGKLLGLRLPAQTNILYLWSYNSQYPIAEIKNATFEEVEAAAKAVFSVTNIDALSSLTTPNETKLKDGSLQKALPSALVTTYTYQPLVGMLTATDPSGITTYYEYDTFNRLKRTYIKDASGKEQTIQTYDYHYQNQ